MPEIATRLEFQPGPALAAEDLPPIAEHDVFVLGPRRSGLHAAVNWIIPHFPGLARLVNDHDFSLAPGANPLAGRPTQFFLNGGGGTWRVFDTEGQRVLEEQRTARALREWPQHFPGFLRPLVRSGLRKLRRWQAARPESAPAFALDDAFVPAAVNYFVVENLTPAQFAREFPVWHGTVYTPFLIRHGRRPPPRRTVVLVLRDPWNTLASLIRRPQPNPPRPVAPATLLPHWLEFAREFAGETAHAAAAGRVVRFNYDLWFRDPAERRRLSAALGRPHTDRGLEQVADFGGGSSFDGLACAGRAQAMTVGERWREFARHPLMAAARGNAEAARLSERLFGGAAPGAMDAA